MGWTDEPLNQTGVAQANQAAEQLEGCRLARIFSSPLRRALETAEIVAARQSKSCEVQVVSELGERGYGKLEGQIKSAELSKLIELEITVEPWPVFTARVESAMSRVARHSGNKLVVSHSGLFKAFRAIGLYSCQPERDTLENAEWVQLRLKN